MDYGLWIMDYGIRKQHHTSACDLDRSMYDIQICPSGIVMDYHFGHGLSLFRDVQKNMDYHFYQQKNYGLIVD
jgi:hypothetical protein